MYKSLYLLHSVECYAFAGAQSLAQLAIVDSLTAKCGFCYVIGAAESLNIIQQ
jgi:hypothetical protein